MIVSAPTILDESVLAARHINYLGFRIWEIADIWATPALHNRRDRVLEEKALRALQTGFPRNPPD